MTGTVAARLKVLGITLPPPAKVLGNYVPAAIEGNIAIVNQAPVVDGKVKYAGRMGAEVSLAQGEDCARITAINVLGALSSALDGNLDRVRRCVRLGGFIAVTAEFKDHGRVMNSASDLMVQVFGDKGRHSRFTVGVMSLPADLAMIIEGMFYID